MMSTQVNVNLVDEYHAPLLLTEKKVRTITSLILSKELEPGCYSISIINCTDNRIRELNQSYRNVDEPTDVLTFPMNFKDLDEEPVELGDIFLSIDTIKRQAGKWQNTPQQEYVFMLIHGLLHIIGYEHEGPYNDKEEMFQRQRYYFDLLQKLFNSSESVDSPSQ
ncbi:MAG: rRNA maturation RNase YbeY [Thermotogota bacterium]